MAEDTTEERVELLKEVLLAEREVERLRAELRDTERRAESLRAQLQSICPHTVLTETPSREVFRDGFGFPPTQTEVLRTCGTCKLSHYATARNSPLFGEAAKGKTIVPAIVKR